MGRLKVGALVDNLKLGARGGIEKAAELGLDGVQIFCTSGEMHPDSLSKSGRRDLKKLIESKGLALSALCADFMRGLKDAEANNKLVPETVKCFELARDMGVDIVTTHFGEVPEDAGDAGRRALEEALKDLDGAAEKHGVSLASETGAEPPPRLKGFLESLGLPAIKVNFDPANLTMHGWSALDGVRDLAPWIVHTHAKDGKSGARVDCPLGEGEVPWEEYIAALEGVGYRGFFTIEREGGEDRVADFAQAAAFLRRF